MKILVFSDSHDNYFMMPPVVNIHQPDMILHLGDHYRDAVRLSEEYPAIEVIAVAGNCDNVSGAPLLKCFSAAGKTIFMAHGHLQGVKMGVEPFISEAKGMAADMALFGHTHIPYFEIKSGMYVINPGSIGEPRRGNPSYAVLDITQGKIACTLMEAN